jgi:hypothetical protein
MADLTAEEDEALKEIRGAGARRDFSVIFSHSRNVNHLFLGPARFVNVSASIYAAVTEPNLIARFASTTARTTVNYSGMAATSHSRSYGQ